MAFESQVGSENRPQIDPKSIQKSIENMMQKRMRFGCPGEGVSGLARMDGHGRARARTGARRRAPGGGPPI